MTDNRDIRTALDMLGEAVDARIVQMQRHGARQLEAGRYDDAQDTIARAKALEAALRDLRTVGQRLLDAAAPSPQEATSPPEPQVPTPPTLRERPDASATEPLPRGRKTPRRAYRVPILRALVEAGGAARTARVLDRVYELMQHRLNDYDLQMKPSGREPRWRNTAQFERLRMVREGLLADDSPTGIWEITEAGRRYLAEQDDKQSPDD